MGVLDLRLACTDCRAYRDFEPVDERVVRCRECGKRHATDSLQLAFEDEEAFDAE